MASEHRDTVYIRLDNCVKAALFQISPFTQSAFFSTQRSWWSRFEMGINEQDKVYLQQCVDLAREAVEAGDHPFGSILIDAAGNVRYTDRNRVVTKQDVTWHPEFTIVVWAQTHMSKAERAGSTVYTSGEHCQMCSTAHGYAGLGRIVFASSSQQLGQWLKELGVDQGNVRSIPIKDVLPNLHVDGPDEELAQQVRELHEKSHSR